MVLGRLNVPLGRITVPKYESNPTRMNTCNSILNFQRRLLRAFWYKPFAGLELCSCRDKTISLSGKGQFCEDNVNNCTEHYSKSTGQLLWVLKVISGPALVAAAVSKRVERTKYQGLQHDNEIAKIKTTIGLHQLQVRR